jgi:hypothetical protein
MSLAVCLLLYAFVVVVIGPLLLVRLTAAVWHPGWAWRAQSVVGTSKAHCPRQLRAFPRPLPKPVDPVNGTDGSANPMVGDLRVMVDFVVAVGADVDGGVGQFGDLVQEIVLGVVGDGVGLQQADP